MGCDIHPFIEYNPGWGTAPMYQPFASPRLGRDYTLFALMAGVRGGEMPVVPPRGMPSDASWQAKSENRLLVTDDERSGDCARRSDAERWVASGQSKWCDDQHGYVTNPDWHSHSWLSTDELIVVRERLQVPHRLLEATIAAMRVLPSARLVFWFDN